MSLDIRLVWSPLAFSGDVSLLDNDLAPDEGLETAVIISLFTDRRAEFSDTLPFGITNRRGWWADAVTPDKIGSRLWLLGREKNTPDVLSRAQQYARESLDWLVEDAIAESVTVVTSFLPKPLSGVGFDIQIARPKKDPALFRFGRTWDAQALRG